MSTQINLTQDGAGRTRLEIHNDDARPSWRTHGSGTKSIDITLEPSGDLYIHASERPDSGRVGKEVFVTIPKEAAKILKKLIK